MEYAARLLEKAEAADGTWVLRASRPEGYPFRAGQWALLTLPELGFQDERGLRRPLSIASSPTEGDLLFATKRSESAFKKTLGAMAPGAEFKLGDARGNLLLPENAETPLVFLAGGVGITPFRSLLRYASDTSASHRITLFYSNRTPEEAAFLDDLLAIGAQSDRIAVVATMTRMAESSRPWGGLTGRLTAAVIREQCPYWSEALHYIAGPPAMSDTLENTLKELGVAPERIRPEKFSGYGPG